MKPLVFTCLACLSTLLALLASAAPRTGVAQVRLAPNGAPCFTRAEREERGEAAPEFQAVTVTQQAQVLWHMRMPRDRRFSLRFSMCIPYAGRVPALPQTPAAPLVSGVLYTVQLEVAPGKSARAPRRYVATFCLLKKAGGQLLVGPAC